MWYVQVCYYKYMYFILSIYKHVYIHYVRCGILQGPSFRSCKFYEIRSFVVYYSVSWWRSRLRRPTTGFAYGQYPNCRRKRNPVPNFDYIYVEVGYFSSRSELYWCASRKLVIDPAVDQQRFITTSCILYSTYILVHCDTVKESYRIVYFPYGYLVYGLPKKG